MLDSTAPIPLDYQLPADAYYHLIRALRLTLPPPRGLDPGATPSAEDLVKRDHAAIARIAGLAPGNAAEADFAAQYVAASEQWKDCLRLVREPETTPEWALKCRAQAATMMRQADSAMRVLLQMQGARRKLEADNTACTRRDWTEHVATHLMAEALAAQPAPAEPAPEPAEKPAPCPRTGSEAAPAKAGDTGPAPVAEPQPAPALTGAALTRWVMETDPELIAGAERYAAAYPERAAKIRRTGKRPGGDTLYFDPPEASLVPALIGARTPALLALEQAFPPASAG